MKTFTKITTLLLFMFLSTNLVAQNEGIIKNAKVALAEMNSLIVSEDANLALSETQQAQIEKLLVERMTKVKDLKKSEPDEEKFKEARKPILDEYYKKIFVESLSKEQRTAYQTANKKAKEKK
jgi:hypothetical protein